METSHGNNKQAQNNFSQMLPSPQSELAQAITKDNYDFGFVELPKIYIEEQLDKADSILIIPPSTDFSPSMEKSPEAVGKKSHILSFFNFRNRYLRNSSFDTAKKSPSATVSGSR